MGTKMQKLYYNEKIRVNHLKFSRCLENSFFVQLDTAFISSSNPRVCKTPTYYYYNSFL